jgi:hypothetical protein
VIDNHILTPLVLGSCEAIKLLIISPISFKLSVYEKLSLGTKGG